MATFKLAQWWEPGAPDKRIPGTLYETDVGGLRLHLDGHFGPQPLDLPEGVACPVNVPLNDYPMLLGITSEGKFISLIDCHAAKAGGTPGFTKTYQEIIPRIVGYDVHFESVEDFRLTSLSFRYSNLDEWAATSGFAVTLSSDASYPVTVRFEKPKGVEAELSNGLKVGILFSASGPDFAPVTTEMRIQQKAWLSVSAPDERPYEELLRTLSTVADFIALGIGQPMRALECEATAFDSASRDQPKKSFRFRLHHNAEPIAPVLPDVDASYMAFTLREVKDRFGSFLNTWCAQDEKIKPLYNLYFGTLRSPKMYVEHRFLNMFQALEAFDRRDYVRPEESVKRHEDRLGRIMNAVESQETPESKKDKKWLKNALRYSHEMAAADRIRRLVEACEAAWIFGDWEADIQLAANFRNFYTHYDLSLLEKLPPLEEQPRAMHNLAVRLQLLCEIVLLRQVGFDFSEVKHRMEKTRRLERRLAR